LRSKVMGDDQALGALNGIVHPAVQRRRAQLLDEARARGERIVINDIPLLFEALDPKDFDAVVLVDAPPAVRRARLRLLRGLTNAEADAMIAAQMPSDRKRGKSQYIIDNDGSKEALEQKAKAVFDELTKRANT
ncbi:MAG TPA: dephospho-CoA kinase, partial [Gemmatimonadales bacterium]|nr:dephospho-CoA kinase [Gemmatimonadales bacterium]